MSLQTIINSAQTIEITRSALVATSVSRSGRLLTAARNWVKPWKFTVEPQPIFAFADYRGSIEQIMTGDRFTEIAIKLGQNAGAAWTIAYQGQLTNSQLTTGLTVSSSSTGNQLVLNLDSNIQALDAATIIFAAGDVIQPAGHRYPYVVTANVVRGASTSVTAILNRGILPQSKTYTVESGTGFVTNTGTGYTVVGKTMSAGTDVTWITKVSSLPAMKLLPGKFIQFTGTFEIVESVL